MCDKYFVMLYYELLNGFAQVLFFFNPDSVVMMYEVRIKITNSRTISEILNTKNIFINQSV